MIATALAGIMTVIVLASGCGNEGSEGRDTQKRTESQTGTGFDDSYQIGDTVTVTYDGDLMNFDSAAITH